MQQGASCASGIGLGGCRRSGRGSGGRVRPGNPCRPILWSFGTVLTQGLLMLVFLKARLDLFRGPVVDFIVTNIIWKIGKKILIWSIGQDIVYAR